jgi:hypothetical protein
MRKVERFGNGFKRETAIFPKLPETNASRFRVLQEGLERERKAKEWRLRPRAS